LIYNILGRLLHIEALKNNTVYVGYLKTGQYILKGMKGNETLFVKPFVKL
jgi:hypothetical protein